MTRFLFRFVDGHRRLHETSDISKLMKLFDHAMVWDHMTKGEDSRYQWHGNNLMEVIDSHKGTAHLDNVTQANTWWLQAEGSVIMAFHRAFVVTNLVPQGWRTKGKIKVFTAEQAIDTVWQLMYEYSQANNNQKEK